MASWADWNTAIGQAKLGITPAELHGSVTGYLCAGWGGRAHELLAALALESADAGADDALHALLDAEAGTIHARLRAGNVVEPLLPEGRVALRADAMVDWCRGLLGGLGLTGVLERSDHDADTQSLLSDLGHIASAHLACSDDDEAALADVLEFIEAGVVHLHAAFAPAGQA